MLGGGLVTAVMSFLRSEAAPLYQYQGMMSFNCSFTHTINFHNPIVGTIVTADHAVKTPEGWKRVRDTGRSCSFVLRVTSVTVSSCHFLLCRCKTFK